MSNRLPGDDGGDGEGDGDGAGGDGADSDAAGGGGDDGGDDDAPQSALCIRQTENWDRAWMDSSPVFHFLFGIPVVLGFGGE